MGSTKTKLLPQTPPLQAQLLEHVDAMWKYLLLSLDAEDIQSRIDAAVEALQDSLSGGTVSLPDDLLRSMVMYSIGYDVTNQKIKLVNDAATPGNRMFYGTNSSGAKGWQSLDSMIPSANTVGARVVASGETLNIPDTYCKVVAEYMAIDGELQLDGDACLEVL